jgi:hypothetical protein
MDGTYDRGLFDVCPVSSRETLRTPTVVERVFGGEKGGRHSPAVPLLVEYLNPLKSVT